MTPESENIIYSMESGQREGTRKCINIHVGNYYAMHDYESLVCKFRDKRTPYVALILDKKIEPSSEKYKGFGTE